VLARLVMCAREEPLGVVKFNLSIKCLSLDLFQVLLLYSCASLCVVCIYLSGKADN